MRRFKKDRRSAKTINPKLVEFLKQHLRIAVTCHQDFLGTPQVQVSLLLDGECIATSEASIPEHSYDPEW
jgi:hypothetical protein